jgi:hypothetical protein
VVPIGKAVDLFSRETEAKPLPGDRQIEMMSEHVAFLFQQGGLCGNLTEYRVTRIKRSQRIMPPHGRRIISGRVGYLEEHAPGWDGGGNGPLVQDKRQAGCLQLAERFEEVE